MVDKNLSKHKASKVGARPDVHHRAAGAIEDDVLHGGVPGGTATGSDTGRCPGHCIEREGELPRSLGGAVSFLWIEKKYAWPRM